MDSKPIYQKLIIYYFSGTGNAKNAAQWMIKEAQEQGINSQLVNIDQLTHVDIPETSKATLIGFCAPTHGFNMPPIALKFIWKFPRLKNVDVFILNTRAGLKLSKLFVPGLSGLAQFFPAILLIAKGFSIIGMQPLDLPSNWILIHPGVKQKVVDSIYQRCQDIVIRFAKSIFSGKRKYQAFWSFPIDILVIPLAIAYYFIGRFFIAKTLIATDACNHCGKCVEACPVQAISMGHGSPFWSFNCESCMRCINICPQRAIETAHGYVLILYLLSYFLIAPALLYLLKWMGLWEWIQASLFLENMYFLLYSAVYLIIVLITYRILHYAMRFKLFNRMIRYTSLSSYSFWRRYKAPKQ